MDSTQILEILLNSTQILEILLNSTQIFAILLDSTQIFEILLNSTQILEMLYDSTQILEIHSTRGGCLFQIFEKCNNKKTIFECFSSSIILSFKLRKLCGCVAYFT